MDSCGINNKPKKIKHKMKAEIFIELIEQGRFDKISKNGMTLIAERFRQLQTKQLAIQGVVASLPNKKEMNIELHEQFLDWRKTENGLCRKAFTLGFKQCYYWFKSKETK